MPPRRIHAVVEQAHQVGGTPHHRNVRVVIEPLKKFADVVEDVYVFHLAIAPVAQSLFQSLCSPHMSRAGRRGEDHYAGLGV